MDLKDYFRKTWFSSASVGRSDPKSLQAVCRLFHPPYAKRGTIYQNNAPFIWLYLHVKPIIYPFLI